MRARRSPALAGWGIVAVLVSGWLALVEVFWLPLRIGGVPVPLSVVAAVGGNLLLTGAAHRLSGSRLVAVLPAVVWLVVVIAAMVRQPEGDLVITGGGASGGINLAFLLLGVTGAAFGVGRALAAPRRAAPPRPEPAGSGTDDVR